MANKTIAQLDTITPTSADEIPIWDMSEGKTGKATLEQVSSITSLSIMASSTTMTGRPLATNTSIKITFTSDITGADTSTPLSFIYNGQTFNVKVGKHGILSSVYAHEVSSGVYKYIQAWTTLELVYDGTQFIVVGNPIVLSSNNYTIYADGYTTIFLKSYVTSGTTRTITLPVNISDLQIFNMFIKMAVSLLPPRGIDLNGNSIAFILTSKDGTIYSDTLNNLDFYITGY